MNANQYQKECLRTEPAWVKTYEKFRLEQGLMGLCGEAGECIDLLKKVIFQGHELDKEHLAKELGDVCWYVAVTADAIGYDLETIFDMNQEKLRARYPETFDPDLSIHRSENDI